MSRDKPTDLEKRVLEKRQATLHQQYAGINEQYDTSLDESDKILLKSKILTLKQEIEDVESDLIALEQRDCEQSFSKELKQKLCQIDFKDQIDGFNFILNQSARKGCTGIFVLQDTHAFAGDLLSRRLQNDLSANASDFDYCPVGFSSGITLDETGLLTGLSRHLGLSPRERYSDEDLDEIINKLCKSLQTKKIHFIELKEWHKLPSPESVLDWLKNKFYPRLNALFLKEVSSRGWRRAYIFILVVSDDILPNLCTEKFPCIKTIQEPFQSLEDLGGILNVSLDNWTQDDIEDWLENVGLPESEIVKIAERFYRQSRGFPRMICDAIEKEFCTLPNSD